MNNPPPNKQANPKFIGREWRDVKVGELVDAGDIRWAEIDSTVEEATLVRLNMELFLVFRVTLTDVLDFDEESQKRCAG